ncbi:MAG: hypothetical protein ABI557_04235 [Aureliella sp.]
MLMLWAAPVPVGHCHSDFDSRVSAHQMVLHLQLYHGGIDNANNLPSGWHWHWVLPPNGQLRTGCDLTSARRDRMLSSRADDLFGGIVVPHLDFWQHRLSYCKLVILDKHQHSFQTVALLHSGQSLPELLGIMRC